MNKRYPPDRNRRRTVTSWPIIITCFIIWPLFPLGLILMFMRLNSRNKYKSREYRQRYYRDHTYRGDTGGHIYEEPERSYDDDYGHTYEYSDHESYDAPSSKKSTGKAPFIVSLAFFFVGGLVSISAFEDLFIDGLFGGGFTTLYVGLCFILVGFYFVLPKHIRQRKVMVSQSSFIVSMSLFFVGGLIIIETLTEIMYNSSFYESLTSLFVGLCFIVGAIMIMRPRVRENSGNDRYEQYVNIIGRRMAVPIREIAKKLSISEGKAYSDLQKMIFKGYFSKTAFLDKKIGYLLLSPEAYGEIAREDEEKSEEDKLQTDRKVFALTLKEIRKLNDNIADPILSEQIGRLESIAGKIFRAVEEDTAKRSQIQRFMDYYLPTTLKLIKSYSRLERQGENGENITNAKIQIEDTMEELVAGYEKLLDSLYQDDVLDISTDIEVLATMMAKDGYTDKNKIQVDNN